MPKGTGKEGFKISENSRVGSSATLCHARYIRSGRALFSKAGEKEVEGRNIQRWGRRYNGWRRERLVGRRRKRNEKRKREKEKKKKLRRRSDHGCSALRLAGAAASVAAIVLNLNNHEKMLMPSLTRRNSMIKQKEEAPAQPSWNSFGVGGTEWRVQGPGQKG